MSKHKITLCNNVKSLAYKIVAIFLKSNCSCGQYSALANEVCSGRGKVPVADYKVVQYVNDRDKNSPLKSESTNRSCYSFCMCPGGQVCFSFCLSNLQCTF